MPRTAQQLRNSGVTVVSPSGNPLYTGMSITNGYDRTGRHGFGMFSLYPESTGTHVVETSGRPGGIVAIGPSVGDGFWRTRLRAAFIVAISLVCSVSLMIATAVERSRYYRTTSTMISV